MSVKLCTSDGSPVEAGETGILWVRGGNVMLGYYNDPAQTERVLQNGWLCTGDLAERNEEGLLRVKGRSDDLIIRAGMNIYPQEIESALKEDPRVREVMAYGMPHPPARNADRNENFGSVFVCRGGKGSVRQNTPAVPDSGSNRADGQAAEKRLRQAYQEEST